MVIDFLSIISCCNIIQRHHSIKYLHGIEGASDQRPSKSTSPDYGIGYYISSGGLCVALIGIVLAFGGGRYLIDKMQPSVWGRLVLNISMLGVLGLSVVLLTASGYNPFIYFRF